MDPTASKAVLETLKREGQTKGAHQQHTQITKTR